MYLIIVLLHTCIYVCVMRNLHSTFCVFNVHSQFTITTGPTVIVQLAINFQILFSAVTFDWDDVCVCGCVGV